MDTGGITFTFAAIFLGAAAFASAALYTRQPIIIAYIALGTLLGPYGSGMITNVELVADAGHVGIIFLLFLLGLDMQPKALINSLRDSSLVALLSSIAFACVGYGIALLFGFGTTDSLVIGAALMFSSTIIGIKLLPTTVLHHKHLGEVLIALLLFQDLLAIILLVILQSSSGGEAFQWTALVEPLALLPILGLGCWGTVRCLLIPLIPDLADDFSFGEIRNTHQQNMVLADVKVTDLFSLWQGLQALGLSNTSAGHLTDLISCPGGDFCSLANARSLPVADAIARRFDDLDYIYDLGPIELNISGCMNACGHHHIGHIGVLGVDKKGEEFFQVSLGGKQADPPTIGKILGPSFKAEQIPDVIDTILSTYVALRDEDETFIETCHRLGVEPFKERVYASPDH